MLSLPLLGTAMLTSLWVSMGLVPTASAANCECDHRISPASSGFSGSELGVMPGDVVCIEAGAREILTIDDVMGSESAPVIIRNCGGKVVIANADRGYGININSSAFFRLTGTGDPNTRYGFDVSASRTGPDYSGSSVAVGGLSTDYEIDHVEAHHSGFAGMILKTESRCDGSANLGNFVQENTRVHHNYIHDTGGEGIYFGSTGYGGREFDCDGSPTVLYPHEHHGVRIHDNLITETGWDGLQVGVSPIDCQVYRNTVIGVGRTATDSVQTRGMQFGGASACEIYDNVLADGPTIGLFILGALDTLAYNNAIYDFAEDGIYANDQGQQAVAGSSYVFLHNTVVRTGEGGLTLFGPSLEGNVVGNNLLVATGGLGVGGDVEHEAAGNLEFAGVGEAGFEGPDDFHLSADSPARDQGAPGLMPAVAEDLEGLKRDGMPDVGAYEYTEGPRPEGGAPGGEGGAASGGSGFLTGGAGGTASGGGSVGGSGASAAGAADAGTASTDDEGGCGCRMLAPMSGAGGWAALGILSAALVRRRLRRVP